MSVERPFDLSEEIMKCVRCGQCRAVCPIFLETGLERNTPRGRIILSKALLEGSLEPDYHLEEALHNCLLCHSCVVECPNGVNAPEIILHGRVELARRRGLSPMKKGIFRLLNQPRLFGWLTRWGGMFMALLARPIAGPYPSASRRGRPAVPGLRLRWQVPLVAPKRLLPPLASRSFLQDWRGRSVKGKGFNARRPARTGVADWVKPSAGEMKPSPGRGSNFSLVPLAGTLSSRDDLEGGKGLRVAFFVGCAIDHFYPEIGRAVASVLARNGVEVVVPEGQVCCGIPALASGDLAAARESMIRNLKVFGEADYAAIVTACATCGSTLKVEYPGILTEGEPELRKRAATLAARVRDISEYLVEIPGALTPEGSLPAKVTYHDPCHLKKVQGVKAEPRAILASIPDLDLVEMKNADACCGCGGSYSLKFYETAVRINDRKIKNVQETGAAVLATSCPGCILHLRDGMERRGARVEVVHVVQLLEQAYSSRGPQM